MTVANTSSHSIYALELGPMENFVYLLVDDKTNTAAVVDPAWDIDKIIDKAKKLNVTITDVLLTHSHHDHINGLGELLNHYDAQVHILKSEAEFWGEKLSKPKLHHGGDAIKLGNTEIEVMHTPGHTPGSACYRAGKDLITGDTLFVFGCGRCDLQGGDPEQMYTTLKHFKSDLPTEIVIHPGHNYAVQKSSTLKEEIEGNPFMHFTKVDQFVRYRMKVHDQIRNSPYDAQNENELKQELNKLQS
ncbi:MAG: MBL fold metallo-hydrolase [Gammaproteobacteria bacterium]|nr:MAG: MBL fold metallo-hydrolase [Gammaproteobacteria bacterium]